MSIKRHSPPAGRFVHTRGRFVVEPMHLSNVLLWANMSAAWVEVLQELFTAGLLWREPCSLLVYLVDGGVLQLPLAKRLPKHGYAKPHWAPSVVRPIEHIAPATRAQFPQAAPARRPDHA
jgi:hypothetical protein